MDNDDRVPLPRSFYEPPADKVAPALLGHWLLRRTRKGWCGGPIVETEAYLWDDPACHAAPGLSPRNRVMFGPPGHAYVYFIYGAHYCVNAVCRPAGTGEAVLIRAIEAVVGQEIMEENRRAPLPATTPKARQKQPTGKNALRLTNGPAKLCEAMRIDRKLDGADLCDPGSQLMITANPDRAAFLEERGPMTITTRIGITKAAHLPLRFCLKRSPFLSRPA